MVIGLIRGESLAASTPTIAGGGLAGLACLAAILFVSLILFFAVRNLSRALGAGRLKAMLFGATVTVSDDR